MKRIVFVLGSNVGNRKKNINIAIDYLERELRLAAIKKSYFMKNLAMLPNGAPKDWNREFFNRAVSGNIDLNKFSLMEILKIIKYIEKKIGRVDRGFWSPREIDIDIALIDGVSYKNENLSIPHKDLTKRNFFIEPILAIEKKILLNTFPKLVI